MEKKIVIWRQNRNINTAPKLVIFLSLGLGGILIFKSIFQIGVISAILAGLGLILFVPPLMFLILKIEFEASIDPPKLLIRHWVLWDSLRIERNIMLAEPVNICIQQRGVPKVGTVYNVGTLKKDLTMINLDTYRDLESAMILANKLSRLYGVNIQHDNQNSNI